MTRLAQILTILLHLSLLLPLLSWADASGALKGKTLKICGDGAEWPPYHFRHEGSTKGYDLDVLHAVLDPMDISFEFDMPPWKRCQLSVLVGDVQVAVSASYSKERDRDYLMTAPYYGTIPAVVSTKQFTQNRTSVSIKDIQSWKVCGLHGYNYSYVDVNTLNMVFRGLNYASTIKKLGGKPCDIMLARKEAVLGFNKNMGIKILEHHHVVLPVENAKTDNFYMLISRKFDHAKTLKHILDNGFKRLKDSGELEAILNKYL